MLKVKTLERQIILKQNPKFLKGTAKIAISYVVCRFFSGIRYMLVNEKYVGL